MPQLSLTQFTGIPFRGFAPQPADRTLALAASAASLGAGLLTAFTVSLVGEMPVGELILFAVAGWLLLTVLLTGRWPFPLLHHRLLWIMLGTQLLALCAYVFSDLYRGSSLYDIERGWGRMGFLWIDILAIAYLVGCSPRNFGLYLAGQLVGDVLHAFFFGALFGDFWKFGVAIPLTYLVLAVASRNGAFLTFCAAILMAGLHVVMDFRSFAISCLCVATLTALQLLPRALRPWTVPVFLALALGAFLAYRQIHAADDHRSTRSDVARSSMLIAAWEGIERHPLTGNGSWFSHSDVWDNFMRIRQDRARVAHVGGFPEANESPGTVAFHTQILVALAEGGIFGGSFFILFAALLVQALYRLTFRNVWRPHSSVFALILTTALWNVGFSPFSGAHRVYIAAACGVLLLLHTEDETSALNPWRTAP